MESSLAKSDCVKMMFPPFCGPKLCSMVLGVGRARDAIYRKTRSLRKLHARIYQWMRRSTRNRPLIRYFIETCAVLLRRGPVVTVFGSCRQDSVGYNFAVTPIRDGLTYPHFTGEVLQAIDYCSHLFRRRPPDLAFRTGQLGRKIIPRWLAYLSFIRTDVFVVEIASALSYELHPWVFHHEIHDNLEEIQSRHSREIDPNLLRSIRPVVMEWPRIRQDLEKIIKILGPKRVVFVTHFSTRLAGRRSELSQAIEGYLKDVGIPVINPSHLLDRWTAEELFVNEPVLSHYSPLGHSIIGGIYRDEILLAYCSLRSNPRPPLVQVVDNSPEKVARHSFHGWGDIVLGSAYIFQEARRQGRLASVDWSGFSAADCLDLDSSILGNANSTEVSVKGEVSYLFHGSAPSRFRAHQRVFTNKRPSLPLDGATRDFLFRSGVRAGSGVTQAVEKFLVVNELVPRRFVALHIRAGDGFLERENYSDLLRQTLKECIHEVRRGHGESLPIVVMADSIAQSLSFDAEGVLFSNSRPGHLGIPGDEEASKSGLVDFFLMGLAEKIYSASAYSWGSGFSLAASQLFDVTLVLLDSSSRLRPTRNV